MRRIQLSPTTKELVPLMSELARLTSPRSSIDRSESLGLAYRKISYYAERHNLGEDFCDKVMILFLETQHGVLAA